MNNKLIHSTGEYITWVNAFAYICTIKDAHCTYPELLYLSMQDWIYLERRKVFGR